LSRSDEADCVVALHGLLDPRYRFLAVLAKISEDPHEAGAKLGSRA
jgi:hypothetical protein